MAIIDGIHLYSQATQYWELVKRTLEQIFGVDPTPADALRREINRSPVQEQLLFYHAEPLDVAADLAGRQLNMEEPGDKAVVERYNKLADSMGWGLP